MMTPVSDGRSADRPKLGECRSIRWATQGVFVPSPASKRDGRARYRTIDLRVKGTDANLYLGILRHTRVVGPLAALGRSGEIAGPGG
jgi:hypothetical protein